MKHTWTLLLILGLWLHTAGLVSAGPPPAKVVEQFIEAHLQGQFAASRSFTLERANLQASLFGNWFFGTSGPGNEAPTADLFLSRKFAQAFRYTITGTTPTGDNQVAVAVVRSSPNLAHLYTWALAPKRGSAPYELIDAVDAYITKVNFPLEESRLQFLLVREGDSWYISTVVDDKFAQLQQQLHGQSGLNTLGPGPSAAAASGPTTTSTDIGRQLSDAQFNATLQGFNRAYQGPVASASAAAKASDNEPGFFGKLTRSIFGGSSEKTEKNAPPSMNNTFKNLRDALARYAAANNGVPDISAIYDWKSLRRVVNQYAKVNLPPTEAEARFTFVNYSATRESYTLVVDLIEPEDGAKRLEISPYGIDRVN
jgi:hypothetical protein